MPLPDTDDLVKLSDIVTYGERALRHLGDMSLEQFLADEKTFDGVIRCIQIVGEAAWKISRAVQVAHPDIPWMQVAGMRHRLVHDYGEVDPSITYRTAMTHLPDLIRRIRLILDQGEPRA